MIKSPLRSKILIEILGIIVVAAFLIGHPSLAGDPGVGWHIKTGEWIARHQIIPSFDPFLLTTGNKLWICNQWLSDLIFFGLFSIGGWGLLTSAVLAICIVTILIIVPKALENENLSAPTWLIGLLLIVFLSAMQWMIRPVIFSFIFFALVHKALRKNQFEQSDFVWLPLLFALWANMHPAFPLGLLLIGIKLVSNPFEFRRYFALLSACLFATLINPYGFGLHRSILGLTTSSYFMSLNTEWLSPNFHDPFFTPLLVAFGIIFLSLGFGVKYSVFDTLSLCIFSLLALQFRRYIPFLAVAASGPILISLQKIFAGIFEPFSNYTWADAFKNNAYEFKLQGLVTILSILMLGLFFSFSNIDLGPDSFRPAKALNSISPTFDGSLIFHSPDQGGYITFKYWPHQKAWIDDRNELNGQQIYDEYLNVVKLRPHWREIVNGYNFRWMLLDNPSAITTYLKSDAEWKLVYEDEKSAVFKR